MLFCSYLTPAGARQLALPVTTQLRSAKKLNMVDYQKVVVGIPAYNAQETIGKTIESALNQTWSGPMEILVLDDGSTDATEREVRRYGEQDGRIRYEKLPENRGRAEARNAVLQLCESQDVLAWLDADDVWHPEKTARQMAKLEQLVKSGAKTPEIIVTCPYRRQNLRTRYHKDLFPPDCYDIRQILELASRRLPALQLQTMLGAVEAWRLAGGFDPRLNWAEDYEFFIRWGDRGGRLYSTPCDEPLVTYYHSIVGRDIELITWSQNYVSKKHDELFKRHGVDWLRERAFRDFYYRFHIYSRNGRHFVAWKQAMRAARDYPGDFGGLLLKRILAETRRPYRRFLKSLRGKGS